MTMSVSSTTLVVGVQHGEDGGENTQVSEEIKTLVGEYIPDSAARHLYNQSEEYVYRQDGGPWVLYWDEKSAGWWFAEEQNYNITGLFFAPGEKEQVPEAGWQWRGFFGVMYYDVPLTMSWKKVQEVIDENPAADAEMLEDSSEDVLTIVRAMSSKKMEELKAVTLEKSAGAQAAAQQCYVGCFDFFTRPDNIAKVKKAIQACVPNLGKSEEPSEEHHFELLPSVATWHGPPRLKKIEATVENSERSVEPEQEEVAADLLRAREEFIDFFASRAKADGQRSVLIEETLRRKIAKEALESNGGLRCLQLEAQAISTTESHVQEISKLTDQAARNTAKVVELQEALREAEERRKEAKVMADDRCVQLEAALRERSLVADAAVQSAGTEHAGKVEELAASLKDQAGAVLEMKEYADQQAQKCAAETEKCAEAEALLHERSAHIEELAAIAREAQADAAEAKAAVDVHSKRCADLELMLQQAPADGCGQKDVQNLQTEVAKLESEKSNLLQEAATAISAAQSATDSYAKRCAELEALLQEAPAAENMQEEIERVKHEADAAIAESQAVIDSYAKRCAELEALLQDTHAAGGAQDEVPNLRAQLANLEAEYAEVAEMKASAQRSAEMLELMERNALAGDSSQEVLDLREQLAELQEQKASAGGSEQEEVHNLKTQMAELQENYSDRIQELESALETQDMQRIQSIEAGLQDQYLGRIQELEAVVQELDAQGASGQRDFEAELNAVNSRWADQMANSQADTAQLVTERAELEREVNRLKAELAKAGSPSRTQGVVSASGVVSPKMPAATKVVSKAQANLFQQVDTDGDGVISRQEFEAASNARILPSAQPSRQFGRAPAASRPAPFKAGSVSKAAAPPLSGRLVTRTVAAPTLRTAGTTVMPGHVVSTRVVHASHVVPQSVPASGEAF